MGTDSGYVDKKVYSKKAIELKDNDIFCEGRQGKISINFNDCLDGYYKFYNNRNLCSNIKPENYYPYEKTKTFMPCQSPYKDCSGPKIDDKNMNCISYQNNYFITEDTNSCYDEIIINYLDGNILRRCHQRCSKCAGAYTEESMNCLECLDNEENKYFYRKDINNCILKENFKERENKIFTKIDSKNFYLFIIILLIAIIIALILSILGLKHKEKKIEEKSKEVDNKISEEDEKKNVELQEYNQNILGDDENVNVIN